jgi:membrane-associated phospholipid phosphatase
MDAILAWGLDFIRAVQQVRGPVLDVVFETITALGNEAFLLALLPLLFWCFDVATGARITFLLVLSGYVNFSLKDWIREPRPFHLDPDVGVIDASGYGMPSGHAQVAVAIWGALAVWLKKAWVWIAAVALMVAVGVSRIYLGVHFPTQVLVGWAVGTVLLGLYVVVPGRLEPWLMHLHLWQQLLLALGLPLVLVLINASPNAMAGASFLMAFGLGLIITVRYGAFSVAGPGWKRALRFVVGVVVMFAGMAGLSLLFPEEGAPLYAPLRAVRYGLVGLWISLGAPWAFRRLGLAPPAGVPAETSAEVA